MTDHTNKTSKENDTQLKDEQLDEAAGGTGSFTKPSERESATGQTIIGGFKTMSGMDSETEVVEYQDGDDISLVLKA